MAEPFVTFRWLDAGGREIGTISFTAAEWDLAWARWRHMSQAARDAVLDGRARVEPVPIEDLAELMAAVGGE